MSRVLVVDDEPVIRFALREKFARGGTLLLDEIGGMPLEHRPKLLRVLQQRVSVDGDLTRCLVALRAGILRGPVRENQCRRSKWRRGQKSPISIGLNS